MDNIEKKALNPNAILRVQEKTGKKARNSDDAWKIQEMYNGKTHGWIQWKGTDVCMDVHCACGEHFHIDATFAYHVKCPKCGRVYMCNGHIELIELEEEPDDCVITGESDIDGSGTCNVAELGALDAQKVLHAFESSQQPLLTSEQIQSIFAFSQLPLLTLEQIKMKDKTSKFVHLPDQSATYGLPNDVMCIIDFDHKKYKAHIGDLRMVYPTVS